MTLIKSLITLGLLTLNLNIHAETTKPLEIEVYRSPSCGCCSKWITHLKDNQFTVKDHLSDDMSLIKAQQNVPNAMASCHTALINGYVIEGHVPATDIKKLLNIKPNVIGISVPQMPMGTPGMEMGDKKDAYNVVSFDKKQQFKVFNHYEGN